MFAVFWRAILDRKRTVLAFLLSGVGLMWMYAATYSSVQATSVNVSEFVKSLPPELNKAFGLDPRTLTTFQGYIGSKQFSLIWPMMMVMLMAGLAANFIAGEVEKGTIELTLAQPISRLRIAVSKIFSGVLLCLAFAAISVLPVIPFAKAYHISIPAGHFWLVSAIGFCFGLAVFGLAMFASAFFSDKGRATFLIVGILLAMYVVNIVALLKASVEDIKFASYFYYFDYTGMLLDGKIGLISIWVFLSAFLGFSMAGTAKFIKRDIAA